jgi:hypothetical protein
MGSDVDGFNDLQIKLEAGQEALDDNVLARVGTAVDYAPHVEFGTAPHEITPDEAEALRFEVDDEIVYTKRVMHPGTPPQPFMRPAVRQTVASLEDFAERSKTLDEMIVRAATKAERVARRRAPVDTGNLQNSIRSEIL